MHTRLLLCTISIYGRSHSSNAIRLNLAVIRIIIQMNLEVCCLLNSITSILSDTSLLGPVYVVYCSYNPNIIIINIVIYNCHRISAWCLFLKKSITRQRLSGR